MKNLAAYRSTLVFVATLIFFCNIADFTERFGIIPLWWIIALGVFVSPLLGYSALHDRMQVRPLMYWGVGYATIAITWFYVARTGGFAFPETRLRLLSVMFLFLLLFLFNTPKDQHLARVAVAWGVVVGAAINIYEAFFPMTFSNVPGRSMGLYNNINQSGEALVLGSVVAYAVVPRKFRLPFMLITVAGVFLTFSRASLLALAFVIVYHLVRSTSRTTIYRNALLGIIGIIVASQIISVGHVEETLQQRGLLNMSNIERIAFFTNGDTSDASASERKIVAEESWRLIGEKPVLGYGTGFNRDLPDLQVGAHNMYLAMMLDHGVFGIVILPLFVLAMIWGLRWSVIDLAIPAAVSILIWGMFSHTVLEDRFLLVGVAIIASAVTSARREAANERRERVSAIVQGWSPVVVRT